MRWWVHVPQKTMAIDNASVAAMDFTGVPADVFMAEWREGKGELERLPGNGLREAFIDVMPYAPLFQRFLTVMKTRALSLGQAKKVQVDLIRQIFDSKRQAPFHYPVAAGDYYWDASDETMGASTALGTQNVTSTVNQTIVGINDLVTQLNSMYDRIDGYVATYLVNAGNNLADGINSNVVTASNNALTNINAHLGAANTLHADPGNTLVAYINNVLLNNDGNTNSINNKLKTSYIVLEPGDNPVSVAAPGLVGNLAHATATFQYIGQNPYFVSTVGHYFSWVALGHVAWSGPGSVSTTNVQWIPVGSTTPVTVTPSEQTAIINGIAQRTNDLNLKMNTKIQAVMALTTVDAVIAYDVTAGW